jgi:cobalamin biosynthesis protein CobD/CbiB
MRERIPFILLRLALALAFIYPPISAHFAPYDWIGYFPSFMRNIVSDQTLLGAWGILELVIGVWILSGKRIFIPSVLAAVLLVSIVLFNPSQFEVVFRDLSIAFVALALAFWSWGK